MAMLLDLPLNVLDYIFTFLDYDEAVEICFTCQKIYELCQKRLNSVWAHPIHLFEESGEAAKLDVSSSLSGLWSIKNEPYGGLLKIQFSDNEIIATQLITASDDVFAPLKCKPFFKIELKEDKQDFICCLPSEQKHKFQLEQISENELVSRCCDPSLHQDLVRKVQKFVDWAAEEIAYFQNGYLELEEYFERRTFILSDTQNTCYLLKRIQKSESSSSIIQPGLFKCLYGRHGTEIFQLIYENNGVKMKLMKITGDCDVPAGKMSIEVDCRYPMVLSSEEQETVQQLIEMKTKSDVDVNNLPIQPFVVPTDYSTYVSNIPETCCARFSGNCQVAYYGFEDPSFSPGHWIVFDENTFGFLFFEYCLLYMFSRITQNL